jgi:transposase
MRKRKEVSTKIEEVKIALEETKNKIEFQKLQCVYLADTHPELTAKAIGEIVRLSEHRVKIIHANFRKSGMASVKDKRGGRYREYMTVDEETKFLEPFEQKGQSGSLIVANEIKKAYEAKIGKEVAESTIYRLLSRHDFRKIVPYKRHKKADVEKQEAFKKTSSLS